MTLIDCPLFPWSRRQNHERNKLKSLIDLKPEAEPTAKSRRANNPVGAAVLKYAFTIDVNLPKCISLPKNLALVLVSVGCAKYWWGAWRIVEEGKNKHINRALACVSILRLSKRLWGKVRLGSACVRMLVLNICWLASECRSSTFVICHLSTDFSVRCCIFFVGVLGGERGANRCQKNEGLGVIFTRLQFWGRCAMDFVKF